MKNLILVILLSVSPMLVFSQINVKAPNGDVGVGLDVPLAKLHIKGPGSINTDPLGVILEDAKLGLGVTTSRRPMHIRSNNAVIQIDRNSNSPGFIFSRYNSDYSVIEKSFGFFAYSDGPDDGYVAFTDFHQGDGGGSDRRFVLDNDGSMIVNGVGVNTSPYTLHVFGDAAKTDGLAEWTIPSDKRLKKDIKKYNQGLDLILKMEPVSYEYNGKAGTTDGQQHIGVLAQDLQKIAPSMVKEYKHVDSGDEGIMYVDGDAPERKLNRTEDSYLGINTSALKWITVNAIKEQQEVIEEQTEKIDNLEQEVADLKEMMQALLNGQNTDLNEQSIELNGTGAYLEQNQPNPFNKNTLIRYNVPADATNAIINVFNDKGQLIHSERIAQMGAGQIQIKADSITAGTYSYSLVVNGDVVDTKRMVIAK